MQSASSECLAILKEIGVGQTVRMTEINQRIQTANGGGMHGFVNRALALGALRLDGHIKVHRDKPDRVFTIMPKIHELNVRKKSSGAKGVTREPGLKRPKPTVIGPALMTREAMRDMLLNIAAALDVNPLASCTVQELVAELGRRYEKGEK